MAETEWPQMTSQYGVHALRAGLVRLHELCACTRPRSRVPKCTHARSRTHRPVRNTYCFSTAKMIRERTSVLGYTYIALLDLFLSQYFHATDVEFLQNRIYLRN
jgi:hypothetical protein